VKRRTRHEQGAQVQSLGLGKLQDVPLGHFGDIAYTTEFAHDWGSNLLRYEIMQFTGLHDKNGVEIYEGDIIRGLSYYEDEVVQIETATVTYQVGRFVAGHISVTHNGRVEKELEVIGNMFENSQLVEE
jgi:uncharacterized phage protein (TIGR01671 family)